MTDGLGREAMRRLRSRSVCAIDPGLTDAELRRVEEELGIRFADDHREFLSAGLPVNTMPRPREPGVIYTHAEPWPDWRNGDRDTLRDSLDRPVRGVLLDVEHGFWHDGWGPRPTDAATASATAERMLRRLPPLIPVYGHRYLPGGHGTSGHPVLSIWQTDIIYYGVDLADYIDREFGHTAPAGDPRATVEFWRDLL